MSADGLPRTVTAAELARAAGIDPKTFRAALRRANLNWHAHYERWEVPFGSAEHRDMSDVLAHKGELPLALVGIVNAGRSVLATQRAVDIGKPRPLESQPHGGAQHLVRRRLDEMVVRRRLPFARDGGLKREVLQLDPAILPEHRHQRHDKVGLVERLALRAILVEQGLSLQSSANHEKSKCLIDSDPRELHVPHFPNK